MIYLTMTITALSVACAVGSIYFAVKTRRYAKEAIKMQEETTAALERIGKQRAEYLKERMKHE